MYAVRILEAATRQLAQMDKAVARRIIQRINWLAENFDEIRPEPLTGELAGFFKLRVGDYRVIYQILRAEKVIVIHMIDHRRQVYRKK